MIIVVTVQRRYPCTPEEREVCLLVLTADGYLKVLNADTGVVLKSVFLSSAINNQFRYKEKRGRRRRRVREREKLIQHIPVDISHGPTTSTQFK